MIRRPSRPGLRAGAPPRAPLVLLVALATLLLVPGTPAPAAAQTGPGQVGPGDWPAFLYGPDRQSWNPDETALSPTTAPALRLKWQQNLGGSPIAAAPAVVGDTVYLGSWDGNEYALSTADGSTRWKIFLGSTGTPPTQCKPNAAGITSGAAVADGRVFVGGGADNFYALDAATGQPIWAYYTGKSGAQGGAYNWASPIVANGRVYSGMASFCDRPFIRGYVWGADAATGQNAQRAYTVPDGVLGAGVWTSPTLDLAHNRLFATTGSPGDAPGLVDAIIAVDLTTFQIVDAWQIPAEERAVKDPDWSTTPTLYTLPDGRALLAASNKNGIFYTFDPDHLAAGPIRRYQAADAGDCPQCGEGVLASAVYHDGVIYVGGGHTKVGGQAVRGAVRALDAATGQVLWEHAASGPVLGSPAGANGVIVAPADNAILVLDAATGRQLYAYGAKATIWAGVVIAHGVIYAASTDGVLTALEVPPDLVPPTAPPAPPTPAATATATPEPPPAALAPVPAPPAGGPVLYFAATGHTLAPPLRDYWERYGGLAQFGYPLTEPYTETVTAGAGTPPAQYLVQYFERARFEYHPEYAGTPNAVLLGLLGLHFHAAEPPAPQQPGSTYLNGHNLAEPFLSYWQAHGGLFVNGYPIAEAADEVSPTDGKTYRVQYFERVRMEYHPEYAGTDQAVLLGLLGSQLLHERGWIP